MGRVQLRPKPQTLKDDLSIKEKKGGKQNEYPMRQISILIKVNYARGEPPLKCLSNSEFRQGWTRDYASDTTISIPMSTSARSRRIVK